MHIPDDSPIRFLVHPYRTCRDFLLEARPVVQVIFLLRFAAMADLLLHPSLRVGLGALAWFAITAAVYVGNGLSDLRGDRANGSRRPLASGLLSTRAAVSGVVLCSAFGVACSAVLSATNALLSISMLGLGAAYSFGPRMKEGAWSAGAVIGLGAAVTFLAGAASAGNATRGDLIFALTSSAWVAVTCATKDFSDIDGDRIAGRTTLPVTRGPSGAARVVALTSTAMAALLLGASVATRTHVLASAAIALGSCILLIGFHSHRAQSTRMPYKVYMATQYAASGLTLLGAV